jgi:hypothetical protein
MTKKKPSTGESPGIHDTMVLTDALFAILRPRHQVLAERARDKDVENLGDACGMSAA